MKYSIYWILPALLLQPIASRSDDLPGGNGLPPPPHGQTQSTETSTATSTATDTRTNKADPVDATFAVKVTFKNFHSCMAKMHDLQAAAGTPDGIEGSGFTAAEGIEPYCRVLFPEHQSGGNSNDPCHKIVQACEAAGFVAGQAKNGNGLWEDCWDPIVKKKNVGKNKIPLPAVDEAIVEACQEEIAPEHL